MYDKTISEGLNKSLLPRKCLHKILREYLKYKFAAKSPLESKVCQKSNCTFAKEVVGIFDNNIQRLISIVYNKNAFKKYCYEREENIEVSEIENLLNEFETINECSEVKVGDQKLVASNKLTTSQYYLLERKSDKKYTVKLNLDFITSSQIGGEIDKSTNEMKDFVRGCADKFNPYLKDPLGRSLQIEVLSPDDFKNKPKFETPERLSISLKPAGSRSHSRGYATDIPCETVIHELMHLMGLVDEYEEKVNGYFVHKDTNEILTRKSHIPSGERDNYIRKISFKDCRSVSKISSIMSDQKNHFKAINPNKKICKCKIKGSGKEYENAYNRCINNVVKLKSATLTKASLLRTVYVPHVNPDYHCKQVDSEMIDIKNEKDIEKIQSVSNMITSKDEYRFTYNTVDLFNGSGPVGRLNKYSYHCNCAGSENKEKCEAVKNQHEYLSKNLYEFSKSDECPFYAEEISSFTGNKKIKLKEDEFIQGEPLSNNIPAFRVAQFERIIQGSCANKVKKYTTCAKNAYKHDKKWCPDKPSYCEDESLWLDTID
jgi:hypothetical protein